MEAVKKWLFICASVHYQDRSSKSSILIRANNAVHAARRTGNRVFGLGLGDHLQKGTPDKLADAPS